MPTPALSNDAAQAALNAFARFGGDTAKASEALELNRSTFNARVKVAKARGLKPRISVPAGGTRPVSMSDVSKWAEDRREAMATAPAPEPVEPVARLSNDVMLVISDLHAPYQHPDALAFLQALKDKYQPTRVLNVGDELDYHAMSFHESDPDLDSAGRELQRGREVLWELEKMFPRMDLVDSNHGSMSYRRAKAGGVPRHLVLGYRDAVFGEKDKTGAIVRPGNRGDGWAWHSEFWTELPNGQQLVMVHGRSISTRRNVEQVGGACFIQGHHHSTFEIVYHGTAKALSWGMSVGCLIDDESLAFAYNRNTIKRPMIGCAIVINGQPRLLPMVLAKGGRWTGFVP